MPEAPTPITAVSASKKLVASKPTTKADMPSGSSFGGGISAGGMSAGKIKRAPTEKMTRRNTLIKKVMSEHKLSLPQASKYIKEKKKMNR